MALNWNISNVQDYKALTESDVERLITEAVVFATMAVDIGDIKDEETAKEFYRRWLMLKFFGRYMNDHQLPNFYASQNDGGPEAQRLDARVDADYWADGKPHILTLSDLTRRIGLHTNVTTVKSRKKWMSSRLA